jgi:succinyl-diaminopimelate desuccinylase
MNMLKEVKKYQSEMVKDLQGLLRIQSLRDVASAHDQAPFGTNLRVALDYVLDLGKRDGFETKDLDGYAGVVSFGEGEEIVGVLGHLDVVPVGKGWTFDPFGAEIKDGYIISRGAQDDKGPTMAGYYAMKLLKDMGYQPKKRIFLIVGCDEESGMSCMDYYNKHGEIPNYGFVPDADFPVIYGEKGILNVELNAQVNTVIQKLHAGERPNICIGEADVLVKAELKAEFLEFYAQTHHLKVAYEEVEAGVLYRFFGKYSHGAKPDEGVNAAIHALNFVGAAYHDEFSSQLAQMLMDWRASGLGIQQVGAHMGPLTLNIGVVHIEDKHARFVLDIRYPNEANLDQLMTTLTHHVEALNLGVRATILQHKEPLFVDPKSELVVTLEKIYRSYTQDASTPLMTMGGGTYARSFKQFVAFGAEFPTRKRPDWVGQVHQADEGYELEQLYLATAIYAQALMDLTQ